MIRREELELELLKQAQAAAEVKAELDKQAKDAIEYWRSVSPVDTGRYAASVRILKRIKVNGMPGVVIGSTSRRAHLIEFGTGSDNKGGTRYVPRLGVQVDQDTPTPAYAPRAKTAKKFGGDESPARASGAKDVEAEQ